jgi:hypothetical protein
MQTRERVIRAPRASFPRGRRRSPAPKARTSDALTEQRSGDESLRGRQHGDHLARFHLSQLKWH